MIRVIVNGVSFYTTAARIKSGVGDSSSVNVAVRQVYEQMKADKEIGRATTISLYDSKMNRERFNVQVTL
jgi:hypothetical protein